MLHYKHYRNQNKHLIIMIHGFLGSIETFKPAKDLLLPYIDVILVECPGHGQENDATENWSFYEIAKQLSQYIKNVSEDYQSITLYGYSMGGRIALYTALHYPELIDKLIIESSTPGIESEELRQNRAAQDALRSERIKQDYVAFIDAWEQLALFNTFKPLTQAQEIRQRDIRLNHHPESIAKALREYGTGQQKNLWPMLKDFNKPVLILTGSLDSKFELIANRMAEQLPEAQHIIISAGHTIHVENLKIFDTIIVSFIKEENHD
ncbi:2-succinyl-6-hydroxy-2,4-cyclohexadiene-1-carboxylate synthase [Macrococcus animalis]|uniref:2-succinyl-6-hydroxy-2, 4-cyclohexadiene-1-carboxylate synthase n=1 Tax=Macrococcus animalis TaxID=3395467 RepID=UPI0039BE7855